MLAHWDEGESVRAAVGHLASTIKDLGVAAGSRDVGVKRVSVDPGKWSMPAHVHGEEEEMYFVLGGSGLAWQDGSTYEIGPNDCIVYRASGEAHTLRAGPEGLEFLAFGTRPRTEIDYLPRAGVAWLVGSAFVEVAGEPRPWPREVAAGEPEVPPPSERPPNIVNVDEAESHFGGLVHALGVSAGSEQAGLNHIRLPPNESSAPAHLHTAEEELFVVLDGEVTLELTPTPMARDRGAEVERHELRGGHVVSRPPGGGMAHHFLTRESGATMLAYGTRDRKDTTYYPASSRIYFRGLGVVIEATHVGYPSE